MFAFLVLSRVVGLEAMGTRILSRGLRDVEKSKRVLAFFVALILCSYARRLGATRNASGDCDLIHG